MAVDVDTLQIQIEAESTDAAAKVNALTDSLERLQSVIKNGKFASIADKIKGIGVSAGYASGFKTRQRQQILDTVKQTVDASDGQRMESTAEKTAILKNALSGIKNTASSAGNALKKFGSSVASLSSGDLSKLNSGLKSVGSHIVSRITKPFADAAKMVAKWKNSLWRIAFYRAIRTAIASIASALKEGRDNLYQYSRLVGTEFAPAMDSLATSALYLKNSLGAMAAPLIQAVAPAVDYLVDKFIDLLNIIGKVFAALTGKSTYTQAKKYATEYAEAANDAAAATKKFLLGIDELNIIDTPSGSGADALDYGSMFEEVEVPVETMDWAAQMREAIENGDWYNAGAILADKLNSIVDSWDSHAWGENLGKKINNGLNATYGFMTTFDFESVGEKIANSLNGVLDAVDWDLLGRTFASKWNAFIDFIYGFIATFDWTKFGSSIAQAVNGWFDEIDWAKAAQTVSLGIKGVLTSIITFLEETDWYLIGVSIGTFISNIDWYGILGGAATVIADALLDVFQVAFGLVANGLSGNGESILGDALSVAAGSAVALVTTSYLTSLLKTIGTKLSKLSKTKKTLASAVLVAIEFSVSEWSIKEFLNEGDFKNILIDLLSVGASSYLLYRTLGPKGLILGVAVGIVANLAGLTTEISNGLSWNDPKALITEALTIALGGIGGAIGLSKIGFTAGEGLVISLAITAAVSLTAINFGSIAGGQYDSGSAQSVIMSALSTLFAGVGGAALVTALGVATGGVGFAVGIGVGLIINIISAEIAERQNSKNIVFDAFMDSSNGQFTLTDIEMSFEGLAEAVSKSFSSMVESGRTIESVRANLSDTITSVNTLVNEVAIGAVSIDENIGAIIASFEQLKNDSAQIFEEERQIIIKGLAGSIGEVASAVGVDLPGVSALITSMATTSTEAAQGLIDKLTSLSKSYASGVLSAEEYYNSYYEIMGKFQSLMGDTSVLDSYAQSIGSWKKNMNFSDVVDGTSVDTSALANILSGFESSYTTSINSINEGTDAFVSSIDDLKRAAEDAGVELSDTQLKDIATTILGAESDRAAQIQTMQGYYGEVLDVVQNSLVDGLEDEVKRLEEEYDSHSPLWKWFHNESTYVAEGLATYQSDVVAPILSEIKDSMDRIGVDGSVWAGDAIQSIVDSLFTVEDACDGERPQKVLVDDLSGTLENALNEVRGNTIPTATETGENIAAGILGGSESYLNENKSFFEKIIARLPEWAKNILGIHSPSTVFAEIGGFAVAGLLNGISGAWGSVTDFFSEKTSSLKENLSEAWSSIGKTASEKWSSIKSSIGVKWAEISSATGNALTSLKSDTSAAWQEIGANTSTAWIYVNSTIKSNLSTISSNVSSTFKSLVSSAASWGRDLCNNLASGIKNAVGTVTSAASSVAGKISSYLHFSEPDIGPLSDFHTYMPDMLELMAKGIKDNTYLAVNAVSDLAGSVANAFSDAAATELQFPVHEDAYVRYGAEFADSRSGMTGSGGDDSEGFVAGIRSANEEMINVIYAVAQQIVTAVNNSGGDTYMDGVKVTKRATSIQNRQNRMYGKTLQNT